jgi:hypothetical protein
MSIGALTNSKGCVNHGGVSVHGQEVGEEVLVMEVQQMDAKLHKMARDHVPLDGEEDKE